LVTWAQARNWDARNGIDQANVEEWIQWPAVHGPNSFALRIVGESNFDPAGEKSYAPGDIIAVDPNRQPHNRNMVVVHLDGDENASLRQILMDGESTKMLRLLNPSWPNRLAQMPPNARIVGVVIGKYVPE
jgi:SOS-response transcriptional repressor LexA